MGNKLQEIEDLILESNMVIIDDECIKKQRKVDVVCFQKNYFLKNDKEVKIKIFFNPINKQYSYTIINLNEKLNFLAEKIEKKVLELNNEQEKKINI